MMIQGDTAVRRSPRSGPTAVSRRVVARPVLVVAQERVSASRTDTSNECDQLLQATATGDRSAFKSLYQLTSGRLFAAVRRSIWIKSEAEEVLQEVYLKIWNGASAYDSTQAQSITWMMRVARNHSIDHLRRGATRRAHEFALDIEQHAYDRDTLHADLSHIDDAPRPDEWLEIQQDQLRFDQLMGSLGSMQRQVLVLAFRDGCTQADIAERLDAPLGSVKSWMRRALQQLKSSIDAQAASDD